MEMTVVRFSRPLLLLADENEYETIYGFILDKNVDSERIKHQIDNYVSYLAGMHYWANGGDVFEVSYERSGYIPDWIDKDGLLHTIQEEWAKKIGRECMEKLHLTYCVFTADLDEDYCAKYLDDGLIIGKDLYDELAGYVKRDTDCLANAGDISLS
mgnify:CR=1 FL=1